MLYFYQDKPYKNNYYKNSSFMKKLKTAFIISFLVVIFSTISIKVNAQKMTKTIFEKSWWVGQVGVKYKMSIEDGDTTSFVVFHFRDVRYKQIYEYEYLYFNNNEQKNAFILQLQWGILNYKSGFTSTNGNVQVLENDKHIYLNANEGKGYFPISKKTASEIIAALNMINLG